MILEFFIPMDEEHWIIAMRFCSGLMPGKALNKVIGGFGSKAMIIEQQGKRIAENHLPKKTDLSIQEKLVRQTFLSCNTRTRSNQRNRLRRKKEKRSGDVLFADMNGKVQSFRMALSASSARIQRRIL